MNPLRNKTTDTTSYERVTQALFLWTEIARPANVFVTKICVTKIPCFGKKGKQNLVFS